MFDVRSAVVWPRLGLFACARGLRGVRAAAESAARPLSIRSISATSASGRHGLVTNASQPACRAPSACPASAWPVRRRPEYAASARRLFSRRVASQPSIPGSDRSIRMMSGMQLDALLDRLDAVGRFGHVEAGELQVRGVHLARVLIVLDHEHERLCRSGWSLIVVSACAGSRSVNVEPFPSCALQLDGAAEHLRQAAADRQAQAGAAVAARRRVVELPEVSKTLP